MTKRVLASSIASLAMLGCMLAPATVEAKPGNGKAKGHAKQQSKIKVKDKHKAQTIVVHDHRTGTQFRTNDFRSNDFRTRAEIDRELQRRQQTKNEWRNLAIASGAVAVLGLLNKDNTLTFAGTAGALYSLHRYEQDRKSQSQLSRTRAAYFSQPYFYRDGVRYERRLVTKNGQKYYQFVKR
jgi:hypothetical protein